MGDTRMKYNLEQLREYRDLLMEIRELEGCPKCENRKEGVAKAVKKGKGGQIWTEERRKAQSERMKGNQRWKGGPLGPKTEEETLLDIALEPRPEGATLTKLVKNYHCSICNGIGHNARTCRYYDDPKNDRFTPPSSQSEEDF